MFLAFQRCERSPFPKTVPDLPHLPAVAPVCAVSCRASPKRSWVATGRPCPKSVTGNATVAQVAVPDNTAQNRNPRNPIIVKRFNRSAPPRAPVESACSFSRECVEEDRVEIELAEQGKIAVRQTGGVH